MAVVVVAGIVVVVVVVVGAGAALPTWRRIVVPGSTVSVEGMFCEMTIPSCGDPVAKVWYTTLARRPLPVSWLRAAASVSPSTGGTLTLAGPADTMRLIFEPGATGVLTAGSVRSTVSTATVALGSLVTVTSNEYGAAASTLFAASVVCPVTSGTLT